MARLFIIDDDKMLCSMLCKHIKYLGHEVSHATTLAEGLAALQVLSCDLVLLDIRLPDGNGLEALPRIQTVPSQPEVIIITGEGDPDGAELSMRTGAWDYLEKPLSTLELDVQITRALQYREEKQAAGQKRVLKRANIVGESPEIQRCLEHVADAAAGDANVLILGETGTGKELFARTIHDNSRRASAPFVVVDCAALSETLAESVLFGHEKGAFTGADRSRSGLIEMAHTGTLFLDEVGELSLNMMKKFLRVLEEQRFRPLGGKTERFSDFRLIAATNRDLDAMARAGTFRQDLLFRLRTIGLTLPPLRERTQDINALALHFNAVLCERFGLEVKGFSPEVLTDLNRYIWPGNVRELIHTIEKMIASAHTERTLFNKHLPDTIRVAIARAAVRRKPKANEPVEESALSTPPCSLPKISVIRQEALARAEKQYLQQLLQHTGRDIKAACAVSGLGRTQLYHLLKKYALTVLS